MNRSQISCRISRWKRSFGCTQRNTKRPLSRNLRKKSNIVIIGETFENVPPLQITENLNIFIDYTRLNMMDSVKVVEFHKKINELKSFKPIIHHILEENKDKSVKSTTE